MLEFLPELLQLLEQKNLSLGRLRKLLFGARTESDRKGCVGRTQKKPGKRRGHGRCAQKDYTGAEREKVAHSTLKAGDPCPDCEKGKLRPQKQPATTVVVKAQPAFGAKISWLPTSSGLDG